LEVNPMNRIKKRFLAVGALAVTLGAAALVIAPASAAGAVNIDCIGPAQTNYTPGLLHTMQSVQWEEHNRYTSCKSSDSRITTARADTSGVADLSCTVDSVATYDSPTYELIWNTGETSNFASTVTIRQISGTVIGSAIGSITSGKFTGASATSWWVYPLTDQSLCDAPPGIVGQSGVNTLQLTRR
jgi:hypothetical protein